MPHMPDIIPTSPQFGKKPPKRVNDPTGDLLSSLGLGDTSPTRANSAGTPDNVQFSGRITQSLSEPALRGIKRIGRTMGHPFVRAWHWLVDNIIQHIPLIKRLVKEKS